MVRHLGCVRKTKRELRRRLVREQIAAVIERSKMKILRIEHNALPRADNSTPRGRNPTVREGAENVKLCTLPYGWVSALKPNTRARRRSDRWCRPRRTDAR